jgi:hypothetical protein
MTIGTWNYKEWNYKEIEIKLAQQTMMALDLT